MSGKESTNSQPTANPSDSDKKQEGLVHGSIVSQVTKKVKNEPFLFVIAIVALLVSLVTLAAGLGSSDLRFVIVVIALLAFVGIIGYYVNASSQMRDKMRREAWKHEERLRETTGKQTAPNEIVVSPSAPPRTPTHETQTPSVGQEQQAALEYELSLHQRNLARLRAKRAVYAAGEEPLSLLNQIEAEEREIQRIQAELASLNRN